MLEERIQMYSEKPEDFHWVGFGSGSGTNLRECAKIIKPALIFSDRPKAGLLELDELSGAPKIIIDGYKFCGSWRKAMDIGATDEYERKSLEYNEIILEKLIDFEKKEGKIDLIVLGGYMRLVKKPLLDAFKDRIINVHPADLSILGNGERIYIGDNAVYDALKAGVETTKSSVIIVDSGVDHGEILTQGPSLNVGFYEKDVSKDLLRKYASAHQSMQKEVSDWPALTIALRMIADGRFELGTQKSFFDEWRKVYADGNPLGYEGYQVN